MKEEQKVLTLEELRLELATWMSICRDGDYLGGPEKMIRSLTQWAEDNAVPKHLL